MECLTTGTARCCSDKSGSWLSRRTRKQELEALHWHHHSATFCNLRTGPKNFALLYPDSLTVKQKYQLARFKNLFGTVSWWRTFSVSMNLEGETRSVLQDDHSSVGGDVSPEDSSQNSFSRQLDNNELNSLVADSGRSKLIRKLSEANQHNRYLKRLLQVKEDALIKCGNELAVMELELQALVGLAEEVAKSSIQHGLRKINGRYVQSHLLSRLEELHGKVKEKIKDVEAVKFIEIPLFWYGMAESVQVMGSFDGWSQGEQMSPEYNGGFTKFSATLKLRPGRYEIKFLVDGMWQLSPEFPTTGEGLMENNLLVVE